jgi:CHASE2 domain-containing sensor protein
MGRSRSGARWRGTRHNRGVAPTSSEIAEVSLWTTVGAVGGAILWRHRRSFDGRSPLMRHGVWLYAFGLCAIFVVLGLVAFGVLAAG